MGSCAGKDMAALAGAAVPAAGAAGVVEAASAGKTNSFSQYFIKRRQKCSPLFCFYNPNFLYLPPIVNYLLN